MPQTREDRLAFLRELETANLHDIPLRRLEVAWIDATCLYEVMDDPGLSDARWDHLTQHLWVKREKLSPYFKACVPHGCLSASTGSGIDWTKGVPLLATQALI